MTHRQVSHGRERYAFQSREPYEKNRYLAALQKLQLMQPGDREEIHRAYRTRARRVHPDLYQDPVEKAKATRSIQEINAAHAYAIEHWRDYQVTERWRGTTSARRWRGTTLAKAFEDVRRQEWLFLPVTAIYALTTIAAVAPLLALARLADPERRARWRAARGLNLAWRLWLVAAPHAATAALFLSVEEFAVRAWFGLSLLVMLSADVATLVTGDAHSLRRPLNGALAKLP